MNKSTSTSALIGFAVIAALLTGCTATPATPTDTKPAATATASTPTKAPVAETVKTGDVVDATEAHAILVARNGQRAYSMTDGTFVVVTKTEPVPAAVQADANAKAAAAIKPNADSNAEVAAMMKAEGQVAIGTGKRVIGVWNIFGYATGMSETKSNFWTVSGLGNDTGTWGSRAEAQAAVDAFLAGSDADEYVVIYSK